MSLREMHEQQKQSSPREQLQELNRQSRTELENSLLKEALAMSSENCEELMKQSNQEQVRAEQNRQRDAEQNRKLTSELKQSVELLQLADELPVLLCVSLPVLLLPPSAIIQKGGFSMTEHEKYQEHIRHTHDAFCKTVIRHAAIDAARSIRSRRKREISLEYLIEEKHYPFSTTDKYFAEQSGMTSYPLFVCGQMVLLESPELAAALSALSQMEQEIIFLYYFQRLTHREIGRRYGRAGNTTGRRIQMILRRLRAELEGLSYEPATSL